MCRTARSGSENKMLWNEPRTGLTSLRTSTSRIRIPHVNSQPNLMQYYSGQYYYDKHKSFNQDLKRVFTKFHKFTSLPQQNSLQNLTQDHYVTRIAPVSPSQTIVIDQPQPSRANSNAQSHRKTNTQITFTQKLKLKNAGSLKNIKLKERMVLIVLNHNLTKYCYFNIPIPLQRSSQREAELMLHQVGKGLLDQLKLGQIELYFYSKKGEPIKSLFDCHDHKTIIVSPTKQFNGISDNNSVLQFIDILESVLNDIKQDWKSESLETFISKKYHKNIQNIADYLTQRDDKNFKFQLNSQQAEKLYKRCKLKAQKKLNVQEIFQKQQIDQEQQSPLNNKYKCQDDYINDDEQITIQPRQQENEHIIRQYSQELLVLQKAIIQNHDPDAVTPMVLLGGKLVKYEDPLYNQQHMDKLQTFLGTKKENQNTYEVQFDNDGEEKKKKLLQKPRTKKQLLQTLQKQQKLLFTQNIPQLIMETQLNRRELYQTFILYQALEAVSSQMQDDYTIGDGVSFEAFRNGIYQVSMQPFDLAKQMFQQIDYNFSGSLNWREFLNLMVAIRAKTLMDRVNLFIKIADKDGNRALSYDEVHNLTRICLSKYIKDDCQLLDMLCDYFTKLIFETLGVNKDDDIPMEKIKQTILDGGQNSELLSMFCGADL